MNVDPETLLAFHWRFGEDSCAIYKRDGYDFCFGTSMFRWAKMTDVLTVLYKLVKKHNIKSIFFAIADNFEDKAMYSKLEQGLLNLLANENVKLFRV